MDRQPNLPLQYTIGSQPNIGRDLKNEVKMAASPPLYFNKIGLWLSLRETFWFNIHDQAILQYIQKLNSHWPIIMVNNTHTALIYTHI